MEFRVPLDSVERANTVFTWGLSGEKGAKPQDGGQEISPRRAHNGPDGGRRGGHMLRDNLAFLDALQQIAKDKGISVDVLSGRAGQRACRRLQADARLRRGSGRHHRARLR